MSEFMQVDADEFKDLANPDDGRSDPNKRFPKKESSILSGLLSIK